MLKWLQMLQMLLLILLFLLSRDAVIRRLERQLQEEENEIKILKEQKSTYTKQLETNEETIEEYKTKYVQYICYI